MSPWKAALPALIIGPVTYLVCVAVLFSKSALDSYRRSSRPAAISG